MCVFFPWMYSHDANFRSEHFNNACGKSHLKFLAQNHSQNSKLIDRSWKKNTARAHTDSPPHALSSIEMLSAWVNLWEMRCCYTTVPLSVCSVCRLLSRIQQSYELTLFSFSFQCACVDSIIFQSIFTSFFFIFCVFMHTRKWNWFEITRSVKHENWLNILCVWKSTLWNDSLFFLTHSIEISEQIFFYQRFEGPCFE